MTTSTRSALLGRPTGDLLILLVAGTICLSVIVGGLALTIVEVVNPEADTSPGLSILSDTINTLVGLLAGYLAGRTGPKVDDV